MAMTVLCVLPSKFEQLIVAKDAVDDDDEKLALDFIKSRLLKEENRMGARTTDVLSTDSALVTDFQNSRTYR